MLRGVFSDIVKNDIYKNSEKIWDISLLRADNICINLIDNMSPIQEYLSVNLKQHFHNYLCNLNTYLKKDIDKCFIYFLAVRKKVVFSINNKPYIRNDKLHLFLEQGRDKKRQKIVINIAHLKENTFSNQNKNIISIFFSPDGSFIYIVDEDKKIYQCYIHTFLQSNNIQLNIHSDIHYVGSTKWPESRPFNLEHRGITAMSRHYPLDEYDHFIFYNLFKVTSIANNKSINFIISNGYTNEVSKETEGKIIELALIYYFDSKIQELNKTVEQGELRNKLIVLLNENNIKSIILSYEINESDEYYSFSSRRREPSRQHIFQLSVVAQQIALEILSEENAIQIINSLRNNR